MDIVYLGEPMIESSFRMSIPYTARISSAYVTHIFVGRFTLFYLA